MPKPIVYTPEDTDNVDFAEMNKISKVTNTSNSPMLTNIDNATDAAANAAKPNSPFNLKTLTSPRNLSKLGSVAETALPFVGNVANAIMTSKTPQIPNPRLEQYANLETRADDSAQIREIKNETAKYNKWIDNNISSPQAADAMKHSAMANAIGNLNKIHQDTSNIERAMRNQSLLNKQGVDARNLGLLNQYDLAKAQRQYGIYQDTSKNIAEATQNVNSLLNRRDMRKYQDAQLNVLRETSDDGVWTNFIDSGAFDYKLDNSAAAQEEYDKAKGTFRKDKIAERYALRTGKKLNTSSRNG
jgi:hypothetical protein